jgi:hypothetical protein
VNRLTKHTPSLLLAAILGYQLFVPPSIGLASNGDFPKVVGIFDLGAPSADEYGYIDLTYKFDPQYHWKSGFYSSEVLVAAAAIGLNHFFSKAGFFDLRWMGLIHGALFVLAGYLLQDVLSAVSGWRRWFLWAVAIGCFGDVMYVSYLNSFYMDAAAFAFLILAVALFLRSAVWRRMPLDWWSASSSYCFRSPSTRFWEFYSRRCSRFSEVACGLAVGGCSQPRQRSSWPLRLS